MTDKKNTPIGQMGASQNVARGGTGSVSHFSTNGSGGQVSTLHDIDAIVLAGRPDAAPTPDATPEERQAALLAEGAHDEGNAQATHRLHGGGFAFNDALGWMYHTGTHWATDGAEQKVDRAIVDTMKARGAAAFSDPERYKSLITACIPNRSRVQGAKGQLSSVAGVSLAGFDTDPDKLNCQNGVIDLRTGSVAKHSPAQHFTHCATVDYDPKADRRAWVTWLTDAVGASMADWLQMAVGYSLTGHTREEVLFYLFGPPRAGKGLFSETLLALLSKPLATSVNFDTFTAQRTGDSQNFDLAPLRPTRIVFASESNSYERFNEAKVKALTGGDEVYCAFKHRSHFNYRPTFKIWLLSNQPVNADPDDDAVWGRVRLVHFPKSHLGKEDKGLKERMKSPENLRGVLAWAVEGARRWYDLGPDGLPDPGASRALLAEHRGELDNVGAWLDECAKIDANAFCTNKDAYRSYRDWCESNGITPKQQRGLTQALERKGYRSNRQQVNGKQMRGFVGFRLDLGDR
jgi:putative DNA primase/helicase